MVVKPIALNAYCASGGRGVEKFESGKKKEPEPELLGSDIFRWGGGLPREGVGAKKFNMSLETKLFGGISRDFAGISWGRPKSLRTKSFLFNEGPYWNANRDKETRAKEDKRDILCSFLVVHL